MWRVDESSRGGRKISTMIKALQSYRSVVKKEQFLYTVNHEAWRWNDSGFYNVSANHLLIKTIKSAYIILSYSAYFWCYVYIASGRLKTHDAGYDENDDGKI